MKYALIIATVATIATPAFAEDVGIRVGPAGVTVGEGHRDHYRDRDRDRDGVTTDFWDVVFRTNARLIGGDLRSRAG